MVLRGNYAEMSRDSFTGLVIHWFGLDTINTFFTVNRMRNCHLFNRLKISIGVYFYSC